MQCWRIARQAFASSALSGYGAAQRGGRWNSRGIPVVYAAEHASLAMLEVLAHADRSQLPTDLEYVRVEFPGDSVVDIDELPDGWNVSPHTSVTCAIGDRWVAGRASLALRVPSVIVPMEYNVVLNPAHPRFAEVVVTRAGMARIDVRLFEVRKTER